MIQSLLSLVFNDDLVVIISCVVFNKFCRRIVQYLSLDIKKLVSVFSTNYPEIVGCGFQLLVHASVLVL